MPDKEEEAPSASSPEDPTKGADLQRGGPRSVTVRRCENGFGFTLRHFIVYPPDTEDIICDQDGRSSRQAILEPMDTIFVKNIRENGPAHKAGLATGDRIVNVNGESISGKTYAQVVQLIQRSNNFLKLLVVPKEDDILQLYFSEAAHNPQTNQRPPAMSHMQLSGGNITPTTTTPTTTTITVTSPNQFSHLPRPKPYQPVQVSVSVPPCTSEESAAMVHTWHPQSRRSVQGSSPVHNRRGGRRVMDGGIPKQSSLPNSVGLHYNSLDGRVPVVKYHSVDMPKYNSLENLHHAQQQQSHRRDSTSSLPLTLGMCDVKVAPKPETIRDEDSELADSVLTRIRKSFEQKEEFLRRPNHPVIPREFYAQPQKFQKPPWPPENLVTSATRPLSVASETKPPKQQFTTTLSRIQENIPSSLEPSSLPASPAHLILNNNSLRPSEKERMVALQIVSRRARQFETGEVDGDALNRMNLYRSELSRLSAKRNIPNVASRKHEFEMKSKDGTADTSGSPTRPNLSGNRTTILSTGKLHCDPPVGYIDLEAAERLRRLDRRAILARQEEEEEEEDESEDDVPKRNKAVRQNSYLAAVEGSAKASASGFLHVGGPNNKELGTSSRPARPTQLPIRNPIRPANPLEPTTPLTPLTPVTPVTPGQARPDSPPTLSPHLDLSGLEEGLAKILAAFDCANREDDPERLAKRVSYLKAASGRAEDVDSQHLSGPFKYLAPLRIPHKILLGKESALAAAGSIQRLKQFFEGKTQASPGHDGPQDGGSEVDGGRSTQSIQKLRALFGERGGSGSGSSLSRDKENLPDNVQRAEVAREGWLQCKLTLSDGKRAADRSWKQFWAVLRGKMLYLYKDRKEVGQSPQGLDEHSVDLKNSTVDIAGDYTKKKHVFRLNTFGGSEYLLQGEDGDDMLLWIRALHEGPPSTVPEGGASGWSDPDGLMLLNHNNKGSGGIRKLAPFRSRSPTGHSPVTKTRKQNCTDATLVDLPSPKNKTWKGRVARQLRRIQGSSPTATQHNPQEGGAIGVPLETCAASSFSECVPLVVEVCTSIVEARGLEVVGIYRVPGNTAAVASLADGLGRGGLDLQDPRWNDVNVISSLLKSFFRKLPDPLLTSRLYPAFIEADKIQDPARRLLTLKKLIHELPDHHFETLRYLLRHLQRIVRHSYANKMEARNLAIVFGPTIVRTANDNMVTMVTDMSHQCRIVETLIVHADWFFSDDDGADWSANHNVPVDIPQETAEADAPVSNHNLLLNNIQKVEGMKCDSSSKEISAKEIVSSIISAANRKMQKKQKKTAAVGVSGAGGCVSNNAKDKELSRHNQRSLEEKPVGWLPAPTGVMTSPQHREEQSSPLPAATMSPQQRMALSERLGDDTAAIRTYSGLSASTRERIRQFELETKAMLHRDLHRQRRELERREAEKRRIDAEWVKAKRDLESEDFFDRLADNPDMLRRHDYYSGVPYVPPQRPPPPLPLPPTQQPPRRGNSMEDLLRAEAARSSGSLKRHKAIPKQDVAPPLNPGMAGIRSGSLDSLREFYFQDGTKEDPGSSGSSDAGSDLLTTITTTFDRKLKLLLDPVQKEDGDESEKKKEAQRKEGKRSASAKVRRSDSLSKTEKTECNMKAKEGMSKVKSEGERSSRKTWRLNGSALKRRHTVGGTKDFEGLRWVALGVGVGVLGRKKVSRISAWDRLQPVVDDEGLNSQRSLQTWLKRERFLRTSSPDLTAEAPNTDTWPGGWGFGPGGLGWRRRRRHSLHETGGGRLCSLPLESQV